MNRREFVVASAAAGIANAQPSADAITAGLPDMLLNYFALRIEAERNVASTPQQTREALRRISGPYPQRPPLNPRISKVIERSGYRIENVLFQSRPDFWVGANLYLPAERSRPVPAIVMPRGHFDPDRMTADYQQICFDLVSNGMAVLSFDPLGQGERRQRWTEPSSEFDSLFSTSLEHALIGNLLALIGESSAGYFIWDGMRAVDYLLSRPEIDPKRIGCADHSDNGSESSLLCALDERITCAALHAPSQGRRWPVDRTTWIVLDDTQEYLPGAAVYGTDTRNVFAAISPRPLLVLAENPDGAFNTTADYLRACYRQAGQPDGFALKAADTGNDWPKSLRLDTVSWFARWFQRGNAPSVETDVVPETRSSLLTPDPGKSIYQLIREKAAHLPPAGITAGEIRNFIAPFRGSAGPVRILDSETSGGIRQDRLQLPSERAIWLPAVLHHPAKPNGKVVIYVAGDVTALDPSGGDNDDASPAPADSTARQLAARGFTAISLDVRGIGATAPRIPRRGFRVPYHHLLNRDMAFAMMAWSLNDNLLAMRVRDLLRAVDLAADLGEVWVAGRDMGAVWALFAGAVDERIKAVIVQNGLVSWHTLLDHDRYHQASSQFPWGALQKFDLPQVAALIAPRPLTIINPSGHNTQVLTAEQARSVYPDTPVGMKIVFEGDIAGLTA